MIDCAFKAISWKTWLKAFLIWFVIAFVFAGAIESEWGGVSPAGVIEALYSLAGLWTMFFRAFVERPFSLPHLLFMASFCPVIVVPMLALILAWLKRKLERRPDLRLWAGATGLWWILAGIGTSIGQYFMLGETYFFEVLFLIVFGPIVQIARFFFLFDPEGAGRWLFAVALSPIIWIPIFQRVLRAAYRIRTAGGKEGVAT